MIQAFELKEKFFIIHGKREAVKIPADTGRWMALYFMFNRLHTDLFNLMIPINRVSYES